MKKNNNNKVVIRTLDIETAPNLAHVWGLWNNNVGINQIMEDDFIMSFSYKDLYDDWVYYYENRDRDEEEITRQLVVALDEADIVIGHNTRRFDIPWIQGRAAIYGMKPPSPFKIIDTYQEGKKNFRLPSYKLEYMARIFGCTEKSSHKDFPGHSLWVECLKGNNKAWKEMKLYNMQDVETNEELYLKMLPYIKGHPNMGLYLDSEETVCPNCGSSHINYRGYTYTGVSKFHKFQCQDCGAWGRDRTNCLDKDKRKKLATSVR